MKRQTVGILFLLPLAVSVILIMTFIVKETIFMQLGVPFMVMALVIVSTFIGLTILSGGSNE